MGIKMWEIKLATLLSSTKIVVASNIKEALEKAEKLVHDSVDIIGIELLAEEDEPDE